MPNHETRVPRNRVAVRSTLRRHVARSAIALTAVTLGVGGLAGSAYAAPSAPTPPTPPTLTTVLGTISASFVSPYDGGSAITGYTVDCVSSDGGAEGINTGASSPIVVSGVTNEDIYTCTVVATNSVGDSPASNASSSIEVANVPAQPSQPTATGGANADISVAFTAPDNGGSAITGYTADCASGDGGVENTNTGSSSPIDVTGLTPGDTDYTCTVTATNDQGASAPSVASAVVSVPTTAPDAPSITGIAVGENSVTIDYSPNGTGGSAITGYTATCTSGNGGATQTSAGSTLELVVSSLTNGDDYTCTVDATNGVGTSAESAPSGSFTAITVPDPLTITGITRGPNSVAVVVAENGSDGSDAILLYSVTCTSSNGGTRRTVIGVSSPITVGSLTNGKTYTCTAVATNDAGSSTASSASSSFVAATTPGAPTITSVTLGTNAGIVNFTPGSSGGTAVTGYTATCTSSDGGATQTGTGGSSPITVGSLTNGNTYTCTVTATNPIGDSPASAASSSFVAVSSPSAPTLTGVTLGPNSVTVAFTPGADGGSPITDNSVTCTSTDGGMTATGTGASSPIVVGSLSNSHTYTCAVVSINVVGSGSASAPSSSFVAAVLPDAPTITSATPGNNDVAVAFTAGSAGGGTITGFTATCSSSDGGVTQTGTGASSPVTVSSLSNGNTYTCTVVATNAVGDGPASAASSSFVAAGPPDPPVITSVDLAADSVTLGITDAGDGGSAITAYTATCTSSDGGATQSNSGSTSPITIASLTNGNTYTCTVVATNAIGDSPASVASGSFVAAGTPSAPTIGAVTPASDAGIVAFTPGSDGGGAVEAYVVTCTSGDGGVTRTAFGTSSPITVGSLVNGDSYTCTVLAINAIGDSPASAASSSFVPAGLPSAPTVTGVTPSSASAAVAFTAGGDGGSAITGYTATCTSSDGGATGSNSGSTSPITVGSLTDGNTYTCTVVATNGVGDSPASAASASFVSGVSATVPSAPTGPVVTRGSNSASVAFTASASDGGSAITGYTATCTSSNGGTTGSGSGPGSPINVTTLTNSDTYTCTVVATNGVGDSPASAASASFVAATVPGAPIFTLGTVTHPVPTSATVPFTAGSTGGSAITGFTVTCISSNGGTTQSNSGSTSPITVTGMTAGKVYTCTITATNAIGVSLPSAATAAYTA